MNGKTMFARYNLFHKPSCYLDSVWVEFLSADVAAKIEAPSDMMGFWVKVQWCIHVTFDNSRCSYFVWQHSCVEMGCFVGGVGV